jgi:methyl-accepting chemotaxis protein
MLTQNVAGSGQSEAGETPVAVADAVKQALKGLVGRKPRLGFLFASAKHPLKLALDSAQAASPNTEWLACHTSGELTERGLSCGGVSVLLIASDRMHVDVQGAQGVKANHIDAARKLCANYATANREATTRGLGMSTTVLLVDGLAGTGEKLVREVMQGTRMFQQVVGGAAGDDGAFQSTWVGARGEAAPDAAAAAHVFDRTPWGVGVDHGLRPKTQRMTVTRASGNVLYELDGRPAFDVYQDYAKTRGVTLEPHSAGAFLIGNELGVFFLDELHHARAPVGVGKQGELNLVADITEGSSVCILDGEPDAMVDAAGRAALEARENLRGGQAAGVVVFDCVCRGMILKEQFQREIDAIRAVFPDVPVAGFLTYGEIARFKGRLDGWHNTTTVVAAIPA